MVKSCAVGGCRHTSSKHVSIFKFPQNANVRKEWIRQVKKTRDDWTGPGRFEVVCSEHFTADCFDPGFALKQKLGWRLRAPRKLLSTAVPTVFPKRTEAVTQNTSPPAKQARRAYQKREKQRILEEALPGYTDFRHKLQQQLARGATLPATDVEEPSVNCEAIVIEPLHNAPEIFPDKQGRRAYLKGEKERMLEQAVPGYTDFRHTLQKQLARGPTLPATDVEVPSGDCDAIVIEPIGVHKPMKHPTREATEETSRNTLPHAQYEDTNLQQAIIVQDNTSMYPPSTTLQGRLDEEGNLIIIPQTLHPYAAAINEKHEYSNPSHTGCD